MAYLPQPLRRRLSRRLVRAAGDRSRGPRITVQRLIDTLGDRSFGWCILVFALVNMVPMPIGTNAVTSIPLILVSGQIALGYPQVRLPGFVTRRSIDRRSFQRVVLRATPLIRPIERAVRPRCSGVFAPRAERVLGFVMLAVSLALFVPIPFSGFIPATALFVIAFGLVERDGLVVLIGCGFGVFAIVVTALATSVLLNGLQMLAH